MDLEKIGFYTLSNQRAATASETTPLNRCELLLTDKCNFRCPYCRGIEKPYDGTLTEKEAFATVNYWLSERLKNVRFSGGEPLLWKQLPALVKKCRNGGVEHIAISSNGSLRFEKYEELLSAGVNDFSISLDACCAEEGDKMAGGIRGAWEQVIANIKRLAKRCYVTVGVVMTPENISELPGTIKLADSLGVADIRIISAAQWNKQLEVNVDKDILAKHPILAYRLQNLKEGKNVRGITDTDSNCCHLMLDDMAVAGGWHFPCIIYLREGGKPIGKVGSNMRQERREWFDKNNTHCNPICKKNCLDVCVDYNNRATQLNSVRPSKLYLNVIK